MKSIHFYMKKKKKRWTQTITMMKRKMPSERSIVTKKQSGKASTAIDLAIARVGHDENDASTMTFLVTMIAKVIILRVTMDADGDGGTNDTPHRKSPIVCTGLVQTKGVKNPIEDNDVIENGTNDDEIFRLMHHLMDQMTDESTTAGSNARKIDDQAASPEKGHQAVSEHRQGKDSN
jgi:hypothetical protein